MKKQIIPAGTPGTFRPGHGQFPEALTVIDAWLCQSGLISRHQGWYMKNGKLNKSVYAWQYAPTPPPVDDFEAWCAEWEQDFPYGFKTKKAYGYITKTCELVHGLDCLGTYPTLIEAQRAAYQHFLESLNE